jgi:glutathione S-transferase
LSETRNTIPATLWPTDPKDRAYTDSLLEWHSNHFRPAMVAVLRAKLGSIKHGHPAAPEVLAFLEELRKPILNVLETLLGKREGGFLTGEHLTIADL